MTLEKELLLQRQKTTFLDLYFLTTGQPLDIQAWEYVPLGPGRKKGIGVDNIPDSIRFSSVLTGNDLGRLATVENLPGQNQIKTMGKEDSINRILNRFDNDKDIISDLHLLAKGYIEKGELTKAWQILLQKI